jgi:hypothetical protein
MTDFPNTRRNTVCPLCVGPKDTGLVTCWTCYRHYGLRYYTSPERQAAINAFEAMLEGGFACTLEEGCEPEGFDSPSRNDEYFRP